MFVDSDPGGGLVGAARAFCRTCPNQTEVTLPGSHSLQEDSPDQIGVAIADWYRHAIARP